ncbi:TIGR02466 family protein [Algihabitans albus]|uniref:TIGR02466 family protein n=1 Tax=Algihabitans albus TaxID=2164067 RepID=UPI000E5C79F4|nr:TIGR02466 family protein [Algihabitans albus]
MQLANADGPVVLAFPTPIYRHRWPESAALNDALRALILARRATASSTVRSNIGGWQSSHDLMSWGDPSLATLGQYINEAFGAAMEAEIGTRAFTCKLAVTAWANVNGDGDYNRHHTHASNHWSGVYYVDLGGPDPDIVPNGAIEFQDPRPAVGVYDLPGVQSVATWTIQPEAGEMLLFPSWLRHGVLPFRGSGERISVAFNLRVGDLKR